MIASRSLAVASILAAFTALVGAQTPPPVQPGLVLDRGWLTPLQGGSDTMKDLGSVLSPFAKPAANTAAVPGLKIYGEVTYLMPYAQAVKILNLNQRVVPKNKVICPGFPRDSFFHYAYSGIYEGHFNKLYIVTDKADQVVAIQFVAESPKADQVDAPYKSADYHTYNFVNSRSKAITRLWVDHKPFFQTKEGWKEFNPKYTFGQPKEEVQVLRVDSLVMNPKLTNSGNRGLDWEPQEAVRLYLPKPIMELILHVINSTAR